MERNLSDEHRYAPIQGKNQPKTEKNYMPLTFQNQQKSNNPPLTDNTKKSGEEFSRKK